MYEEIEEPIAFFNERGDLHDARVTNVSWDKLRKTCSVAIDDLNSAFVGLPEYKGEEPVVFHFCELFCFELNVDVVNGELNLYEIEANKINEKYEVGLKFSPGGYLKLKCDCIRFEKG